MRMSEKCRNNKNNNHNNSDNLLTSRRTSRGKKECLKQPDYVLPCLMQGLFRRLSFLSSRTKKILILP